MDKFFEISKRGSTVRIEIFAGLTTFFAMAYIIIVNPNQVTGFSEGLGQVWNAVYVGSILVAVIGTLIMGLYAKMPFAQACGMGLNSFFFVSFILPELMNGGDPVEGYHAGLVIVFISGLVFLILSFTGARQYIAKAMPPALKVSVSAGIGLFIAIVGLKNSGAVTVTTEDGIAFGNPGHAAVALSLLGVIVIAFLSHKGLKGAIFYGILITWLLGVMAEAIGWYVPDPANGVYSVYPNLAFSGVKMEYFFSFDFKWISQNLLKFLVIIFTFLYADMFDTVGTLIGVAESAGLLDEEGKLPQVKPALLSDAIGTVIGACLGTSTVTSFVESSAGAAVGGKTGLTSATSGVLFLISLFLSPLFISIPGFATTPALVYVGYLMMSQIKNVKFEDAPMSDIISAFFAIIMMPFTSSIANGIMFGILSYVILKVLEGGAKEIKPVMWISFALFLVYLRINM